MTQAQICFMSRNYKNRIQTIIIVVYYCYVINTVVVIVITAIVFTLRGEYTVMKQLDRVYAHLLIEGALGRKAEGERGREGRGLQGKGRRDGMELKRKRGKREGRKGRGGMEERERAKEVRAFLFVSRVSNTSLPLISPSLRFFPLPYFCPDYFTLLLPFSLSLFQPLPSKRNYLQPLF